jgi:hypothetical protein
MWDNPFIMHEFFCARRKGTRRRSAPEQTRITMREHAQIAPHTLDGIFQSAVTIMQQIDCNPQLGSLCAMQIVHVRARGRDTINARRSYFFSSLAIW